jgi:prevent-host-death family protein
MRVNVLEAKNNLSKLIAAVEAGEEVTIARDGKPVVMLVKCPAQQLKPPGAWKDFNLPAWNAIDQAALDKEIEGLFHAD